MRYAIWNKQDDIITPSGKVYTAEEWMDKYPICRMDSAVIVCSGSFFNGAYFGVLQHMVDTYVSRGVDFTKCSTDQDKLDAIEQFINDQESAEKESVQNGISNDELTASSLASIAASLEYQNMLTLDDVEV